MDHNMGCLQISDDERISFEDTESHSQVEQDYLEEEELNEYQSTQSLECVADENDVVDREIEYQRTLLEEKHIKKPTSGHL
jgi:hypothetical protein